MKYSPTLTVEENAYINGVSVATVRKYIQIHKINRRGDNKRERLKEILSLRRNNPNWSARRIAKELNIAPCTVCEYLKSIGVQTEQGKSYAKVSTDILHFDSDTPIDFMRMETYDTSLLNVVAFSSGGFTYDGSSIGFGNMKRYPIEFMGHTFSCPETAYIACCYGLNNEDCIRIQKEIQSCTNGLFCKRKYRYNELDEKYGRKDFHQSIWHFNLMLYLVWLKCKKYPEFCEMLLAVPDDTIIIENQNGFKKAKVGDWGCKNLIALKAYKERYKALREHGLSKAKAKGKAIIQTWNRGVWSGCNHQGKILMACRAALRNGTEPCVDYQSLNDAELYLFGKQLLFGGLKDRSRNLQKTNKRLSLEELDAVCTYSKQDVITFKNKGKNAIFSNFHPFTFTVDGITFHSVEQFYHWRRLQGTKYVDTLLSFDGKDNANRCFNYSRNRGVSKMIEKDLVKRIEYMREGLRYKLKYCDGFKEALLNTSGKSIAEINQTSKDNDIWAVNKDTLTGSNILGKLLMELRSMITEE